MLKIELNLQRLLYRYYYAMLSFELGDVTNKLYNLIGLALKLTNPEIEFRLNSTDSIGVDRTFFTMLRRRLDSFTAHTESTTDEIFTKSSEYRRIFNTVTSASTYQQKVKAASTTSVDFQIVSSIRKPFTPTDVDHSILGVRAAIAQEQTVTQDAYECVEGQEVFSRQRERISYFFPKLSSTVTDYMFRIDTTVATYKDNSKVEYQVELELLNLPLRLKMNPVTKKAQLDALTVTEFHKRLLKGFGVLLPTLRTLFTPSQYALFASLQPNRGKPPINIQSKHFANGFNGYHVTNKLDGVAYSLFVYQSVTSKVLYLVLRNNTDCWIVSKEDVEKNQALQACYELIGSEIRVEVVESNVMHLFDLIRYKNSSAPKTFSERLGILQRFLPILKLLIKPPYDVLVKKFAYSGNVVDDVKEIVGYMCNSSGDPTNHNDGIVFQPDDCQVSPLKWKFYSKISVDFKFVKVDQYSNKQTTTYVCKTLASTISKDAIKQDKNEDRRYLTSKPKDRYEVFHLFNPVAKDRTPVALSFKNKDMLSGISYSDLNGLIVECGGTWKNNKLTFHAMKIRWDKTEPNGTDVVDETCRDMIHERTLPMLLKELETVNARLSVQKPSVGLQAVKEDNKLVTMDVEKLRPWFQDTDVVYSQMMTSRAVQLAPKAQEALYIARALQSLVPQLDVVVDGSALVGNVSLCFGKSLTKATTISVERDETNLKALEHNLKQYRKLYRGKMIAVSGDVTSLLSKIVAKFSKIDALYLDYSNLSLPSVATLRSFVLDALHQVTVVAVRVPKSTYHQDLLESSSQHDIEVKESSVGSVLVLFSPKGFGFRNLRLVNNKLKSDLINKYVGGRDVLDLGSGKGGDLFKYSESKVRKLMCVEPSKTNIDELQRRVIDNPHYFRNLKLNLLRAKAQDLLEPQYQKQLQPTYHVISMFFMLTFFFRSNVLLDQLVSVVDRYLPSKGILIGTTMVGTRLKKLLKEHKVLETSNYRIEQTMDSLHAFSNEIIFDLKNTQTATLQHEYLVDFQEFVQRLSSKGIYLYDLYYPDLTNLSDDELFVGSNNLGFVFVKQMTSLRPFPMYCGGGWLLPVAQRSNASFFEVILQSLSDTVPSKALQKFLEDVVPYSGPSINQMTLDEFRDLCSTNLTEDLYVMSVASKAFCVRSVVQGSYEPSVSVVDHLNSSTNVLELILALSNEEQEDDIRDVTNVIKQGYEQAKQRLGNIHEVIDQDMVEWVSLVLQINIKVVEAPTGKVLVDVARNDHQCSLTVGTIDHESYQLFI